MTKKDLKQWYFRITDYAQRLLDDLGTIDWPEQIKLMQTNWIGRSEGAEVDFGLQGRDDMLTVFTTRPDTLFGATYMVLAPEHPLVDELTVPGQRDAVVAYQDQARRQSEIERLSTEKEKTGVFTGAYAVNPVNDAPVPIWISDYVLMGYGTGAIMAVPAHDERDFQFATQFEIPIVEVIAPKSGAQGTLAEAYTGDGVMVNSGRFDGMAAPGEAFESIVEWLGERGAARKKVNFKLRDWLISRQRYWGAPIPMVHCEKCGTVPVPKDQLPGAAARPRGLPPHGRRPLAARPRGGLGAHDLPRAAAGRRTARPTRWTPSPAPAGTTSATPRRTTRRRRSTARRSSTGCRSTCTSAAPSTRSCTCSTRASSARSPRTPAT